MNCEDIRRQKKLRKLLSECSGIGVEVARQNGMSLDETENGDVMAGSGSVWELKSGQETELGRFAPIRDGKVAGGSTEVLDRRCSAFGGAQFILGSGKMYYNVIFTRIWPINLHLL